MLRSELLRAVEAPVIQVSLSTKISVAEPGEGRQEAQTIIRQEAQQPPGKGPWVAGRDSLQEAELQLGGPQWAARVVASSGKCWPCLHA